MTAQITQKKKSPKQLDQNMPRKKTPNDFVFAIIFTMSVSEPGI